MEIYGDDSYQNKISRMAEDASGFLQKETVYQEHDVPGDVIDSVLYYNKEYYSGDILISEEEYTAALEDMVSHLTAILMNSRDTRIPEPFKQYISVNGSTALTAQEMINLLMAQTTAVPNDLTSEDLRGLEEFLAYYAWQSNSYDCSAVTQTQEWRNILEAVVRHPSAVCDGIYPGEPVVENWNEPDPLGRWNAYRQLSESKTDWILTNIFNVSEQDLAALKAIDADTDYVYLLDGYYYSVLGGVGGGYIITLTDISYDGSFYTIQYGLQDYYEIDVTHHLYAVMKYPVIDGVPYWSLYYLGETPPEGSF